MGGGDARNRFVAGRGALRVILGRMLGIAPRAVRFRYSSTGKPWLAGPAPRLHFNATGSEGLGLVAVTRIGEVGVDAERVGTHPGLEGLAGEILDARERKQLESLAPAERRRRLLEHWVCREALAKASGRGLAGLKEATGRATLLPPPQAGTVAAVACALLAPAPVTCWRWDPQPDA